MHGQNDPYSTTAYDRFCNDGTPAPQTPELWMPKSCRDRRDIGWRSILARVNENSFHKWKPAL